MSGKTAREERREERLQKEGQAAVQERRRRLLQLGSAAVFLAVIAVAVLIVVSGSESGGGTNIENVAEVNQELAGIPQHDLVLGQPQAKVTLFEYGDLQCPVCASYAESVLPGVIDSQVRTGKAKIEFRNFTIINEESVPAGAAAIAAGKQGHGWTFLELFYRNQGTEASGYVTDAFMTAVAKSAGVTDMAKWNQDRKSQAVRREVGKTDTQARQFGFSGTPSFAVKGPNTIGIETLGTLEGSGLEKAIEEAG